MGSTSYIQIEEDIIIIKYYTEEFGLTYKMVLSGGHVEDGGIKISAIWHDVSI